MKINLNYSQEIEYAGEGDDDTRREELTDLMAFCARAAGLVFIRATDYGAEWEGTDGQIAKLREQLPHWAAATEI